MRTGAEGRDALAVVFPGMGPTEFRSVAKFMLVDRFARELVAEADDVLGYSLFDRYQSTIMATLQDKLSAGVAQASST